MYWWLIVGGRSGGFVGFGFRRSDLYCAIVGGGSCVLTVVVVDCWWRIVQLLVVDCVARSAKLRLVKL